MSYRVKISDAVGPSRTWFNNSWLAMDDHRRVYKTNPHYIYEELYNVKLHMGTMLKSADYIEFPSEEEATMFILKWS